MKLYHVTVDFETQREAQMSITAMYLASSEAKARGAAVAWCRDNYDVASGEPFSVSSGLVAPNVGIAPIRVADLSEHGWREYETRRPLAYERASNG